MATGPFNLSKKVTSFKFSITKNVAYYKNRTLSHSVHVTRDFSIANLIQTSTVHWVYEDFKILSRKIEFKDSIFYNNYII